MAERVLLILPNIATKLVPTTVRVEIAATEMKSAMWLLDRGDALLVDENRKQLFHHFSLL